MKVIGKTSGGYIIEATQCEIAQMNGFSGVYSDGWQSMAGRDGLREGFEFSVQALAEKVSNVKNNEHKVQDAIKTFRNFADALEKSWPEFQKIEDIHHDEQR